MGGEPELLFMNPQVSEGAPCGESDRCYIFYSLKITGTTVYFFLS